MQDLQNGVGLAESRVGDEVVIKTAMHTSVAMLARRFHVPMGAKRRALNEVSGPPADL